MQSQVRCNTVPEKVLKKVPGGFFWCRARSGSTGEGSGEGLGGFGAARSGSRGVWCIPTEVERKDRLLYPQCRIGCYHGSIRCMQKQSNRVHIIAACLSLHYGRLRAYAKAWMDVLAPFIKSRGAVRSIYKGC